jgi:hypothetical protein
MVAGMDTQTGALAPIRRTTTGATEKIGDATSVQYRQTTDEAHLIEVLDRSEVYFPVQADGFALFADDGTVLASWDLYAPPGETMQLPAGWGFRAQQVDLDVENRVGAGATSGTGQGNPAG